MGLKLVLVLVLAYVCLAEVSARTFRGKTEEPSEDKKEAVFPVYSVLPCIFWGYNPYLGVNMTFTIWCVCEYVEEADCDDDDKRSLFSLGQTGKPGDAHKRGGDDGDWFVPYAYVDYCIKEKGTWDNDNFYMDGNEINECLGLLCYVYGCNGNDDKRSSQMTSRNFGQPPKPTQKRGGPKLLAAELLRALKQQE